MYKYKLIQKSNPQDKTAAKKWYAVAIGANAQNVKAMTRAATENTSTAPIEMEAAFDLMGKYAMEQLLQGHIVKIGNLGTLRVTFKSEGVVDITKFNAGQMIHTPRVLFTPSKELRNGVVSSIQFQNGGVLDSGVSYASLTDYKIAKGITTGSGSGTTPGGGEEDNPL